MDLYHEIFQKTAWARAPVALRRTGIGSEAMEELLVSVHLSQGVIPIKIARHDAKSDGPGRADF
jgi:hypothetical protein